MQCWALNSLAAAAGLKDKTNVIYALIGINRCTQNTYEGPLQPINSIRPFAKHTMRDSVFMRRRK